MVTIRYLGISGHITFQADLSIITQWATKTIHIIVKTGVCCRTMEVEVVTETMVAMETQWWL